MKKILLDTNFLLAAHQFQIDIISKIDSVCDFQYTLFILDKTIKELNTIIAKQAGKDREAARWAKSLIEHNKIEQIETDSDLGVDDLLVERASDYIVATQDAELKKRLLERGTTLLILRQKKYLSFINEKPQ